MFVVAFLNSREPIKQWLFPHYAMTGGLTLLFGGASLSIGHAALRPLVKNAPLPLRERLLLDLATGVLIFALSVFVVGVFGGLGGISFWALPAVLLLASGPTTVTSLRSIVPVVLRFRGRARQSVSLLSSVTIGFGAIGILLVYLPVLLPENVSFDSRWYHLGLAEHYASGHRIGAFPDGWYLGTTPHLAAWLYTWAFTLPGSNLHARVELAAHMEFFLFLATLSGVPLLVERLLHGRRVRGAWAAFFLFPGLFLYDSSLGVGSDHALAFWAIPLALAAKRFTDTWSAGRGLVLAGMFAGAALTRSQALYLLVPAAIYVARKAFLTLREKRESRRHLAYVLAFPVTGGFLVLSAGYWLANLVWYGNPVYPFLSTWFPSHPWRIGCPGFSFDKGWSPEGPLWRRVGETLFAPIIFAFAPHDWPRFHRNLPVFGFLFTVSVVLLPFLRRTGRVRWLAAGTLLGVVIWFWTYHQDRYLQALLPWMVAVTSATFARAWETGLGTRVGIMGLVGLQVVWGSDVPFLPTHAMVGGTPLENAIRLLSSTYRGDFEHRFDSSFGLEAVQKVLPAGSRVLLHQESLRLSLGRPAFTDNPRWHGAVGFGDLAEEAKAYDRLRGWGVSHVVTKHESCGHGDLTLAAELVLHHFLRRWTKAERAGTWSVWTLPPQGPPKGPFPGVAYLGCGHRSKSTLGEIDALYAADREATVASAATLAPVTPAFFGDLEAVAVDSRCRVAMPASGWQRASQWHNVDLWVRDAPLP